MCAALGVALLACLGLTGAAQAAPASYTALGDSYSSGVGAGSYGSSGSCKRSANAYGQLWANAHSGTTFTFLACSGAKTSDVLTQIGSMPSSATLVTLTVGGNDAGFSDVITTCTLNGDQDCVDRVNTAKTYAKNTLPALLDKVYAAVKAKAPGAKLVVLSYPRFYTVPGSCSVGLSDTKRSAINSGADTLAGVISARASAAGAQFVDVRPAFDGHNICSSASDYLHSLTFPVDESYHPTAAGQRGGYYAPLTSAIG
ncbi:SGNH/GDSL hydrolase family protein [Amycolatopsis sp. PS_44_ISF1]|uniref:SGNH/GDSL hydrolase family protein n=1 Tax=Amycolatopsis sp. PS_44_ISF1 TaxID=2974917 RepID=UPI0028DF2E6B|nr:SGNH/GDSL hydrolase family protein [Amycolatopsis sp. PS_44_ISF1]MDT8911603.1 SGNH/GDSL hydrolase family protein [Amycolatopsis sp. PS_44_ISF1]